MTTWLLPLKNYLKDMQSLRQTIKIFKAISGSLDLENAGKREAWENLIYKLSATTLFEVENVNSLSFLTAGRLIVKANPALHWTATPFTKLGR